MHIFLHVFSVHFFNLLPELFNTSMAIWVSKGLTPSMTLSWENALLWDQRDWRTRGTTLSLLKDTKALQFSTRLWAGESRVVLPSTLCSLRSSHQPCCTPRIGRQLPRVPLASSNSFPAS